MVNARRGGMSEESTGVECPKCGYVRTAKDLAHPGECPRCGVIYAKFEERELAASPAPPVEEPVPAKTWGIGVKGVIVVVALFCLAVGYLSLSHKPKSSTVTKQAIENARVILLSTTWCGYCKLAKAFLEKNNIAYLDVDVEASQEGQQLYSKLNGKGVPIILIGETRINGFSEEAMRRALAKEGLL